MLLYRISRAQYANDLTGEGARRNGGRWNLPGYACVYTAMSRSLAMLEFRVHLNNVSQVPPDLRLLCLEVPSRSVTEIDPAQVSPNWRNYPSPGECVRFGTIELLKCQSLLIKVPSVIVPEEFNIIINPAHRKMKEVKIVDCLPLILDPRLFGGGQ
ncbi:MAG: RES family NAD+ phosphorylase [Bacteroidia bacterium]|jgi:RES domain-containing protein|nr:RES family NAD+ phosphorylase [Bacteroidia bacterium]